VKDCETEVLQATQGQLNRLQVIYELTNAILSAHDFKELLKRVSEETTKVFNARGCMIRLIEDGMLKIKANYGFPPEISEALTVGLGESFVGKAVQEGKTMIAQSPEDFGRLSQVLDMQTGMCTPLKIGDQIIGTFGLYDKKAVDSNGNESIVPFTVEDQITLEGFASIAAIVIDKSILYEKALLKEKEANEAKRKFEDLWDHLQGFIQNSADAIVTTDLEGIVTSWNMGAEKMYGYDSHEVIGKYMPFVPDFLRDVENGYAERVGKGETIEDIETVRQTKHGLMLDVNLTISPIKDSSGTIVGMSGIARDITEKKRIEKELINKNAVLSKMLMISSAMRGTLELDRLLRMVLTAVTMGDGLGFNRAMLFLLDEEKNTLKGAIGALGLQATRRPGKYGRG
jgi:PAS domain S-box-containing protein